MTSLIERVGADVEGGRTVTATATPGGLRHVSSEDRELLARLLRKWDKDAQSCCEDFPSMRLAMVAILTGKQELAAGCFSNGRWGFEIDQFWLLSLKKAAVDEGLILLESSPFVYGYTTQEDAIPLPIPLSMKPSTVLRDYQLTAVESSLWGGRMHSGVIVLPCGAGKTATGVHACCAAGRKAIIFVTSSVAAEQWRRELCNLADTSAVNVRVLTAESSSRGGWKPDADIAITTYSLFTGAGKRTGRTAAAIDWLRDQMWGLMVLDEVQFAPAETFRKVTSELRAACKLDSTPIITIYGHL